MDIERGIIEFPYARTFEDYHDINAHADLITDLTGLNIKSIELSEDEVIELLRLDNDDLEFYNEYGNLTPYVGLFYTGRKPKKSDIAILLGEL